jgi:hypothetical protein
MIKSILVIFNQLNIKNNKIDKDNFKKNHNKKKTCRGNTVAIYSIFFKKTTKLNYQPAQYEKKNQQSTILEKKLKKHMGKHCNNPQCFKEKNYKAKFLTSSILKK